MDLENELRTVLRTRDTALPVADPVPGVHRGMARRRRRQRLQVMASFVVVAGLAGGAVSVVRHPSAVPPPVTPATEAPTATPEAAALQGFSALDVTFVGDRGWALGTADCGGGRCTTQLVSTDGGATWTQRAARGLCADGCVRHVRFADDRVGYAYGPDLWITLNGGESWSKVASPEVQALEVVGDAAVRVVSTYPSCMPGCTYVVQVSPVGSLVWKTRYTSHGRGVGAELVRWGDHLVVTDHGNPAGGAMDARTRLALSTDGGQTWTPQDDPCSPGYVEGGPESDARLVALGPEGSAGAFCVQRTPAAPSGLRLSSDGGRTYGPQADASFDAADRLAVTGPRAAVVALGTVLSRTTDGGATWTTVARAGANGDEGGTLSFSSPTQGAWLPPGGTSVWRTTDGGATWTEASFA